MKIPLFIQTQDAKHACSNTCPFLESDIDNETGKCLLFSEPLRRFYTREGDFDGWLNCNQCKKVCNLSF